VRDIAQLLMAAYEGENIKHRTDGVTDVPDIAIDIPDSLKEMEPDASVGASGEDHTA